VWTAHIDPYGQAQVDAGNKIEFSLRFPGHYHDAETGLFYNRFRYYSPELGRYLQSDPIGIAGGLNVYSYTASPLTTVDLIGHHADQPEENEGSQGAGSAGANNEETGAPAPADEPPPRFTREEGQAIIDRVRDAYPSKPGLNVNAMSELEDGAVIITSNDSVRPAQRDCIAQMQEPGGPLEGRTVLLPDDRNNEGYIPPGQRNLEDAPNPARANDAEQRGIQAANVYNDRGDGHGDIGNQWSSGAQDHGGAACEHCERAQNQNDVTNQTGFQSQGGRYDRGGTDPYQNGSTVDDTGAWQPPGGNAGDND
jgi:RHS repeat-associated protein